MFMHQKSNKNTFSALVACLAIYLGASTANAADPAPKTYKIDPQSVSTALKAFAAQSDMQIIFTEAEVGSAKTRGVTGTRSPREALSEILKGTGLQFEFTANNVVVVRKLSAATSRASADPPTAESADKQEGKRNSSQDFRVAQVDQGKTTSDVPVENKEKNKKTEGLEEIVVTGSRIPTGAGQLPAQPVRSYTREDIERSGRGTVAEFLNTLPDNAIGNGETNNQHFVGQTTVQLHGLPVGTTLVLIDGRRVEKSTYAFFDLNNIPLSAIDRIEVLPVGASAVYGSDASAGAVNLILRKDLDGVEASAKYGSASDTHEVDANLAWGKTGDRGSISFIGNYQNKSTLLGSDRAITSTTNLPSGAPSSFLNDYCNPGNVYSLNGQNLPGLSSTRAGIPAGLTGTPTTQSFLSTAGKLNLCNNQLNAVQIPPTNREGALVSAHYQFSDSFDVFSEILYSHESQTFASGNLISLFLGSTGYTTLPANNPYNPFGEAVGVSYSYPGIKNFNENTQSFVRPLIGARGVLLGKWKYEVTGFLSRDRFQVYSPGFASKSAIQTALNSSDPATALNPFAAGAPGSPEVLQSLVSSSTPRRHNSYDNRLLAGQGLLRGPLLDLPSGPVEAVFGAEYGQEKQYTLLPFGAPAVNPKRNSYAFFTEERVPLLANHENPQTGDKLVLTMAARFDDSDDFGSKTTGQGGVAWRPTEAFLIRGGYAMSYRAPQLQQVSGVSVSFDLSGLIDPFRGNASIPPLPTTSGPNPNLKPETGTSRTLGIVYSSTAIRGLEMALTYFGIGISNFIGSPGTQTILKNPNLYPGAVTRAPASPQDVQQGFLGPITLLRLSYYNFGDLDVSGVDFDLRYKAETDFGEFTPSVAVTDTVRWQSALSPNVPPVSYLSQATLVGPGFAPRWKGTLALGWKGGPFSASVGARYTGRYKDYQDYVPNSNELGNFWLIDANFRWAIGNHLLKDNGWLKGSYLSIGAVNLLNKSPQYSFTTLNYDPAEADIRGRFLYAQLGGKW
jgi:iron complex outermembrane receptor protein